MFITTLVQVRGGEVLLLPGHDPPRVQGDALHPPHGQHRLPPKVVDSLKVANGDGEQGELGRICGSFERRHESLPREKRHRDCMAGDDHTPGRGEGPQV